MDYKIDFTDCDYTYNDIIATIQNHLVEKNIKFSSIQNGFITERSFTGNFIGYYKLHERIEGIIDIHNMIIVPNLAANSDIALLGTIMLRKLIEK